jgi:formyltetrahydrofolate-dependent phosphoribosylglycinamide formyltransferase
MFEKLKQRWKVNGSNLILIITTFAIGGSLCGYTGRKLLGLTEVDKGLLWVILYILLVTLLWPIAVILVSIPLGQFWFFKKYIVRIFGRFGNKMEKDHQQDKTTINLAIFASGGGSNAQQIIHHFAGYPNIKIALIVCNKPGAGVVNIANNCHIPVQLIEKEPFFNGDHYLPALHHQHIDYIILAGFLWKIPPALIAAFPKKIVNIHPALLPKYGGKGMFGHHVHEAVITNNEKESGITIHYVDEQYDHGAVIFQARCPVNENDTADTLAQKVHELEHRHFAPVIEELLQKQNRR